MVKTDEEMARKLRERLETELIPKLQNQKISLRTVVAVDVIALVDRQIAKGETDLDGEWEKLRTHVKDHPEALHLVTELKSAIDKYDLEIRTKSREAEADEEGMRKAANGIIRSAIMAKLKKLRDSDREEDAKAAEGAKALPAGEDPAKS